MQRKIAMTDRANSGTTGGYDLGGGAPTNTLLLNIIYIVCVLLILYICIPFRSFGIGT
ncbi:hypothetical protein [Flavobacterium sp.]|uniref:hypothetical protein n=1 Tax=Flavobacterium sp. TaxID=239 RepID=UPI00248709E1|nr:hypothetical protein [Flavobacterium sp.]MDI1316985.1 hypothetical protein [Flavobacterium sp.]